MKETPVTITSTGTRRDAKGHALLATPLKTPTTTTGMTLTTSKALIGSTSISNT